MRKEVLLGFFVFCFAATCLGIANAQDIYNVIDFGAVGDGETDDSQRSQFWDPLQLISKHEAFLEAWENMCRATSENGTPTLQIPDGKTFLLQPVQFKGPCSSDSVSIEVLGNIAAPDTKGWETCSTDCWLCFSNVKNLRIDGSGQLNGRGASWWSAISKNGEGDSCNRPTALHFNHCDNLLLRGITHLHSPRNHISITSCNGVSISNIQIIAPDDSPNTDGIDISRSSGVNIFDSFIGTGDDCIAINGGSSSINITNVVCGPGHGISVGSLGRQGSIDEVEGVYMQNCTFNGTQNGARIKTWPDGSGYARMISFDRTTLIATKNPIIIDQYYSEDKPRIKEHTTAVAVSDVTFSNFQGTSASEIAIALDCSKVIGCENIIISRINITSSEPGMDLRGFCNNAKGTVESSSVPLPCLRNVEDERRFAPVPAFLRSEEEVQMLEFTIDGL